MPTISSYDERELLLLLAKGDELAFTEIYNRYWNKLFSVASLKLNNPFEAEELVQDIFLDLWRRRKELEITNCVSAYLATAVKYKVINMLAKRNHHSCYSEHEEKNSTNTDYSTEQWLSFQELKGRLGKLVTALPEKCRLVFQLSRDAGLSQKAIASELGIAEKTVESHLSKAIQTLRLGLKSLLFL